MGSFFCEEGSVLLGDNTLLVVGEPTFEQRWSIAPWKPDTRRNERPCKRTTHFLDKKWTKCLNFVFSVSCSVASSSKREHWKETVRQMWWASATSPSPASQTPLLSKMYVQILTNTFRKWQSHSVKMSVSKKIVCVQNRKLERLIGLWQLVCSPGLQLIYTGWFRFVWNASVLYPAGVWQLWGFTRN